jgi:hypothetical protein
MISPAERDFALKLLNETRDGLLHMTQVLSPEQLQYRPEPGRWSVAENVEHVVVVERRLLLAIQKRLQENPDLITKPAMEDQGVLRQVQTVIEPVKAPENVLPTSRFPLGELSREFESARQSTYDFLISTHGDLRHHFFPHPVFGPFDCYQWLLLIGAHAQRHTLQSKNVIASPGFPLAAAVR